MEAGSRTRTSSALAVCAMLVAAVALLYGRTAGYGFVSIDDDVYVVANPHVTDGLSAPGVWWALTTAHAANWHPLTWLSHQTDCEMFGLAPSGHHLVSVGLHAANAVLLFLALLRLTGGFWPSAFVAAVFAVHPLRVESVAWIAERKDVLSGLFFMPALWTYARYVERPGRARFAAVAACTAFGLMAKPMLVTLPFVLLLLDVWPLGRWSREGARRLVGEKAPLFALAAASSIITVVAQRSGGAVGALDAIPFAERIANALVACAWYLKATILPLGLAVYYPHAATVSANGLEQLLPSAIGAFVVLVIVSALVISARRSRPYLAVGWAWYLGMLFPVIGVLQVGMQARADRYAYLPLIGIAIAAAWGARDVVASFSRVRPVVVALGIVYLGGCAIVTWRQVGFWRDDFALYGHALEVTESNYFVHNNLGVAYARRRELGRATAEFETALRIRADHDAHNNLGMAYLAGGRLDAAAAQFEDALKLRPDYAEAAYNLGVVFDRRGDLDRAIAQFQRTLAMKPDYVQVHNDLGVLLARQRRFDEAAAEFERALAIDPGFGQARDNLARVEQLKRSSY